MRRRIICYDRLGDAALGNVTPVTPTRINFNWPAWRWTAATREAPFQANSTNYLIDDHAAVVDVEERPGCGKLQ
ncbi:hypothetical protein FHT02_003344 [Sphingomonas xinjiangensis]|uniref:Uncharacterized protein n=1 Tax=Sphingomonas xinjiangensis TaxID=643568 RepID=A0A840YLA1_9SPHN|nr:hypothetical protein [Sphingomonas xinjiangensis]MBB5712088.1 hypothetical protein [Sphingomonas xinjiangensis]